MAIGQKKKKKERKDDFYAIHISFSIKLMIKINDLHSFN